MSHSVFPATKAFEKTRCRTCHRCFQANLSIVSTADGFRHLYCFFKETTWRQPQ